MRRRPLKHLRCFSALSPIHTQHRGQRLHTRPSASPDRNPSFLRGSNMNLLVDRLRSGRRWWMIADLTNHSWHPVTPSESVIPPVRKFHLMNSLWDFLQPNKDLLLPAGSSTCLTVPQPILKTVRSCGTYPLLRLFSPSLLLLSLSLFPQRWGSVLMAILSHLFLILPSLLVLSILSTDIIVPGLSYSFKQLRYQKKQVRFSVAGDLWGHKREKEGRKDASEFKHKRLNDYERKCSSMDHPGAQGRRPCHQSNPERSHSSVCPLYVWPASEGTPPARSCAPVSSFRGGSLLGPSGTHLRRPGRKQNLRHKQDINENPTKISALMIQTFYTCSGSLSRKKNS